MKNYYAWLIALMACLCLLVSNGMTISGLPVYDESLLKVFDWDRGTLKFRDMVTFIVAGLCAPLAGVFLDRLGVRACMFFGWLLLAVAYWCYSQLDNVGQLYGIHAAFGIVLVLCGLNAAVILVSHWFNAKRGTAIGLALVGTSLGGAVMPQYGTWMISQAGWRESLQFAVLFPVVMAVLTLLLIRNRPADLGVEPVGGKRIAVAREVPVEGLSYSEALRTRSFWALALIAMSTFYTVLGAQGHLFLYMRDEGFSAQTATNAISLFFICALVGKFVFGLMADYLDIRKVFYGNILIMGCGAGFLATMQAELIWPAVFSFGLGWGGVYTMIQLSAVNCFGLKAAGKILGSITVLDALGGGLGIWLSGVLYEYYGNYDVAFAIFFALVVFAFFCISQVQTLVAGKNIQPAGAGA